MYKNFIKRILDIICVLLAMIVFCWLYAIVAILVRIKLGSPVIFKQPRPGKKDKNGQERIFYIYKYRSMTDERDADGNLLPDEVRLTSFGKKLRTWSLDGSVIIEQTAGSLENKGVCEVSQNHFHRRFTRFSIWPEGAKIYGGMCLSP